MSRSLCSREVERAYMTRDRPQTSLRNCEESDVIPHGRETSLRGRVMYGIEVLKVTIRRMGLAGVQQGFEASVWSLESGLLPLVTALWSGE